MLGWSQREKDNALYEALERFTAEKLTKALNKGANPNATHYHYASPLFRVASFYSDASVTQAIELLVGKGADLTARDEDSLTILHYLVGRNPSYTGSIRRLMELGSDIHSEDKYGRTPLFIALQKRAWDAAKMLMVEGGDAKTFNKSGRTILMEAMAQGAPMEIVKQVMNSSVDYNTATEEHPAALHVAVAANSKQYVDVLLAYPAIYIDTRDKEGRTPLLAAVANGNKAIVTALLDKKATVHLADDAGAIPLTLAAANGNQDMLELLIAKGAPLDMADGKKATALDYAARAGNIRMVMTLLAAAEEKHVKLALDNAVASAAEKGHGRVLELLIAAGGNVNAVGTDSRTPLMKAVLSDQIETLGILVKAGAKPETVDNHGLSAYDHAVSSNKPNAKSFLSRYRNETLKPADATAPAVASDGYRYSRLNDHSLEVREGDGLTMTFNFWTQQVIFRDTERPAPVTVINFSEMQRQEAVNEAYEKLKELGGTPPDPRVSSMPKKPMAGLSKP